MFVDPLQVETCRVGRARHHTLTGVQVLGTGAYVPQRVVRNQDLADIGYDANWILQRTGIEERRHIAEGQATSDLAFEASLRCLASAGVGPGEIDFVLVGTMTPDTRSPSTACRLQNMLEIEAPAMDLNAACSGFVYALATGAQFVKTGHSRHVLVVGADVMSSAIDASDQKTYPLFGDGAGAVLLGKGTGEQGLLSYSLGADGSGADLLKIPGGGSREPLTVKGLAENRHCIQMDGRSVFKWAVRTASTAIQGALTNANLTPEDVDALVLHQANKRILEAIAQNVGFPNDKLILNLQRYGNTSAASVPLALDEAWREERIRRGDIVVLSGFGAGLTWGASVMRW